MNDSKCINHQQQHSNVKNHNNKPIIMDNDIINIDEKIFLKMLISSAKQMAHNGYIYYGKNAKKNTQRILYLFYARIFKNNQDRKNSAKFSHSLSFTLKLVSMENNELNRTKKKFQKSFMNLLFLLLKKSI